MPIMGILRGKGTEENTMKVFTLEKKDGTFVRQEREIPDENVLASMYGIIGCRYVGATEFTHRNISYTVWYDDEFLLVDRPVATLIIGDLKPGAFTLLCGNLMFTKTDEEGGTVGLTAKDISNLWEYTDINSIRLHMAFRRGLIRRA